MILFFCCKLNHLGVIYKAIVLQVPCFLADFTSKAHSYRRIQQAQFTHVHTSHMKQFKVC